jgi:drug/metabolite transporter (DMT)-like permease
MEPVTLSRQRALAELVFAGAIWGLSFIAIRWSLLSFTPLWLNTLRFLISFLAALPFVLYFSRGRRALLFADSRLSFLPGLYLGATLILQTFGIRLTSIAKSSFITCLYVVFVPVVARLWLKHPFTLLHAFCVFLSLCGAAILCELHSLSMNFGDFLTLLCALFATLQIIEVGRVTQRVQSAFGFTVWQSFWACLLPLAGALIWEPLPQGPVHSLAVLGLAILSVGATLLAFAIQTRAQRVISPAVVSLLFLLESPFAVVFALLLLNEPITPHQIVGGTLILIASALSVLVDSRKKPSLA